MTRPAKFTRGSTMRHVIVMTATSAAGLMSLFVVDLLNLFYISLLGVTELAAAVGFAGALQFFMLSTAIGLVIASVALQSRAIGAGELQRAREIAGAGMLSTVLFLSLVAAIVWIFRREALGLLNAEGPALDQAADFLGIALVSIPLLGIGMASSATLRSIGEARQAMYVTLSGGLMAAVADPVLILALDLDLTGAAIAIAITRATAAGVGVWLVVGRHDMLARPTFRSCVSILPRLAAIGGPAMLTQLSTPFGMAYLTATIAKYGEDAVAGWAVIGRVTAVAFGGVFALAGAVGPIIGQNLGARLFDRIVTTYRDALIFAVFYVALTWSILWLASDALIRGFGLRDSGAEVFLAFAAVGAGGYLFAGALFVSNAAFNNLGRPLWSTALNWSRDGLTIPVLVALASGAFGTATAVYLQATAQVLVGTLAVVIGWRYVQRCGDLDLTPPPAPAPVPVLSAGRTAEAATANPLASADETS